MISETDSTTTASSPTTTATTNHPSLHNDVSNTISTGKNIDNGNDIISNNNNQSKIQAHSLHNGKAKEPVSPIKPPLPVSPSSATATSTATTTTTTTTTNSGGHGRAAKKRKRFDEAIIDGYAIMAFKTWEDLQDELNERGATITSCKNDSNVTNSSDHCTASIDKKSSSNNYHLNNNHNHDNHHHHHHKSSSSSAPSNSDHGSNNKDSSKSHREQRPKKSCSHSEVANSKDKSRNKSSSVEKTTKDLKKALEAKELAEKRLSMLQEKLKQEQSRNRNSHNAESGSMDIDSDDPEDNDNCGSITSNIHNHKASVDDGKSRQHQATIPTSINIHEHYSSSRQFSAPNLSREDQATIHSRPNGLLGQDLLKDPTVSLLQHQQSAPYSPFHLNSHLQQRGPNPPTNTMHPLTPPTSQLPPSKMQQHHQQYHKNPSSYMQPTPPGNIPHHHMIHPNAPSPQAQGGSLPPLHPSHLASQPPVGTPPIGSHHQPMHHSTVPQFSHPSLRPPPLPSHHHQVPNKHSPATQQSSAASTIHPHLMQPPTHLSATNPLHSAYPHQQSSSMISSMSLSSLPSPYSCPPSIYITDTISRQTSIIPPTPPAMGPSVMEAPTPPGARFGPSSVLQAINPYATPAPPHHPAYYPTLPTERSFIEFARSYSGPSHLAYPNLMNPFSSQATSIAAAAATNPYGFDRWPRMSLDHQRAVSRYNSLYQNTAPLPDRAFASYANARPSSFPTGLFPPPF